MISDSSTNKLNSLPLDEVMENNGFHFHGAGGGDKRYKMYACPFHGDNDPSFRVDIAPAKGKQYCGTYCFACKGAHGDATYGAIQLQQRLLERAGEPSDFMDACRRLARDFHIVLEKQDYNCYWRRQNNNEYVPPQKEITVKFADRPFTDEELRALGCQVKPYLKHDFEQDLDVVVSDEQGDTVKRYSFSPSFYRSGKPEKWDSSILTRMFNLYPLRQDWEGEEGENYAYISRAEKVRGTDEVRSYKIKATRSYPIFAFYYEDKDGWYIRKYEPYCKPEITANGRPGRNLKFTWWYQGDRKRTGMEKNIYGDNDVMRALESYNGSEDLVQTDDTRAPMADKAYMLTVGDKDVENTRKVFDKIIICSGPRDALATYFHSDAHVVWPHSESSGISDFHMKRLFAICRELYVMYDLDDTGVNAMNELGLKYPELRILDLPEQITKIIDRRTGKPCKDAEQYFNYFNVKEHIKGIPDVNEHFACMLADAKSMKFWKQKRSRTEEKFVINYSNLTRFLQANDIYNYRDEAGTCHFVKTRRHMVDVIPDADFMTDVKLIMKDYLFAHREYNCMELGNAISTQKTVDAKSLKEIKVKPLQFKTWGKDYDWFFFPNKAVKVTAGCISEHPYEELEGYVNSRAVLEGPDFHVIDPLFTIVERAEYKYAKERFNLQMADSTIPADQKLALRQEWDSYRKLWRWKLEFSKPIEEMPPVVQFVWDTCRVHWEKEEAGFILSEDEQQRQKMHFVNKAASLGYLLSRYRTDSMQQMTVFTDYKVQNENKSSGGTGKTTYRRLIESVRKMLFLPGDGFCTAADKMPTNFQEFEDTVDQVVMIDDLQKKITGEEFKNLTSNMVVRSLYNNKYTIPADRTPKIFCTMNQMLNMDTPSIYRRCFSSYTSDYYHPANYSGSQIERTPKSKFGKDIIDEATPEEYNCMRNLMLQFCQFYLRVQEVILPPMEKDGEKRMLYATVEDKSLVEWAEWYFADKRRFGFPLSLDEMILSYLTHRGDTDLTVQNVRKAKHKFRDEFSKYCNVKRFIVNPGMVYASKTKPKDWDSWTKQQQMQYREAEIAKKSDTVEGLTRTRTWKTRLIGNQYAVDQPRELSTERSVYVFQDSKSVPENLWDLNVNFDTDWEREEM